MKTVLIAWEMGGGLGHLARASAFARELARRHVRVVFAARDLADCALFKWPEDICLLQAPRASRGSSSFVNQASYAELLFASSYHDGNQISALVTSWCHLIDLCEVDIVLADHAPTVHLAARMMGTPLVRVGSGFFAPPQVMPMPRFRIWHGVDEGRMLAVEARVLQTVNAILAAGQLPAAASLAAALAPDVELISSWPELDCYAGMRAPGTATYIGNERDANVGLAPLWPPSAAAGAKKIVAYLKGDFAEVEQVLRSLQQDYATVAYVSQFDAAQRNRFASEHLWLAPQPLDMAVAATACDALICHGGAGTAPLFLEAGKPVLLLPYQAEQRVNSDMIAATGAGLRLDTDEIKTDFAPFLRQFLADPHYAEAAQGLAGRWSGEKDAVSTGVDCVLRLLENSTLATG